MRSLFPSTKVLLIAGALLLAGDLQRARAADYTWDGGGANAYWSTSANWNPDGAPLSDPTNQLIFMGTPARTTSTNTAVDFQLNRLTFASGLPSFTISGSGTGNRINFVSDGGNLPGITYNAGSTVVISAPMQAVDDLTVSGSGTGRLQITGAISGGGKIILNQPLVVNNDFVITGNNTGWSGGIRVDAGVLVGTSTLPFGTGPIEFVGGAVRGTTSANTPMTVANPVFLTGSLTHYNLANNRLTFSGPMTLQGTAGSSRTIQTDGTTTAILEISGPIGDGGNNIGITKTGARQLVLSGTNSFTGDVAVNAGTLSLNGGSAVGNQATVTFANANSPVLELLANETVGMISGGAAGQGEVRLTAGNLTLATPSTVTANYNGTITGGGNLAITGGTLFLRGGNSTYSGGTVVSGNGVLVSQAKGALGTGGVQIDAGTRSRLVALGAEALNATDGSPLNVTLNGGILELRASSQGTNIGGNLNVTANSSLYASRPNPTDPTPQVTSGTLAIGAQTLTVQQGMTNMGAGTPYQVTLGPATLSGNSTLNVLNNGSGEGVLQVGAVGENGGSRLLTKSGSGRLVLGEGSSYSGGTIVSGGTLQVANGTAGSATGSGGVEVRNGATLKGNGTVAGMIDVLSGGTLAPGASTGVLYAGDAVTLRTGSKFSVEVQGDAPGAGYDQLRLSGAGDVTLAGNLDLTMSGDWVPSGNEKLYLINNTGTGDLLGEFANAPQDSIVASFGGTDWQLKYRVDADSGNLLPGSGNDLVLMAVPEPSTLVALAGLSATLGLIAWRRRRQNGRLKKSRRNYGGQ